MNPLTTRPIHAARRLSTGQGLGVNTHRRECSVTMPRCLLADLGSQLYPHSRRTCCLATRIDWFQIPSLLITTAQPACLRPLRPHLRRLPLPVDLILTCSTYAYAPHPSDATTPSSFQLPASFLASVGRPWLIRGAGRMSGWAARMGCPLQPVSACRASYASPLEPCIAPRHHYRCSRAISRPHLLRIRPGHIHDNDSRSAIRQDTRPRTHNLLSRLREHRASIDPCSTRLTVHVARTATPLMQITGISSMSEMQLIISQVLAQRISTWTQVLQCSAPTTVDCVNLRGIRIPCHPLSSPGIRPACQTSPRISTSFFFSLSVACLVGHSLLPRVQSISLGFLYLLFFCLASAHFLPPSAW